MRAWRACLLGCVVLGWLEGREVSELEILETETLFSQVEFAQLSGSNWAEPCFLERLRRTRCLNEEELLDEVDFENFDEGTPFPHYDSRLWTPEGGYDTIILRELNCYVVFSNLSRDTYVLNSLTKADAERRNSTTGGLVYMTHAFPCGVCSMLDQLAVYMEHKDLTSPVRKCGIQSFLWDGKERNLNCLEALGFRDSCKYIWYYNTQESKNLCHLPCIPRIHAPNNAPHRKRFEANYCEPYDRWKNPRGAKNTINGAPVCQEFQWKDGPFRLNACLACDEARSGPVFQRVAGRTRRDSGLESAIKRPPSSIVNLEHSYGFDKC